MSLMRHRLTIALPPERRDDPCAACQRCVEQRLAADRGMGPVSITRSHGSIIVEVAYDPRVLPLGRVKRLLEHAGACFTPDVALLVVPIRGLTSPKGEYVLETVLNRLPGVAASASFAAGSLRIEYDHRRCPLPNILTRLKGLGITADFGRAAWGRAADARAPDARAPGPAGAGPRPLDTARRLGAWLAEHPELCLSLAAGAFLLGAWIVHLLEGPYPVRFALLAPAYLCGGWHTARQTWHTLAQLRFNIDVLMLLAAAGAALIGHPEEGALLLFLFSLGNAGESLAMQRARGAIEALSRLAPESAHVRDPDGGQRDVPLEDLRPGDTIVVLPSERIAADAVVVEGTSAVDQGPITGESMPVDKAPGAELFAGTINGDGSLAATVTRAAGDSTLARIVRLVAEAQTTKSPTQMFTDRFERWYVPVVLVATAVLIVAPPLLSGEGWAMWFYRAMAFLTAASPCALAIGTPAAVLCGIARAAQQGVLIKGGVHLETLGRVRAIAFDKTGTLTRGRPRVTDVVSLGPLEEARVLALAAAVSRQSSHPLSEAIMAEAEGREIPHLTARDVEQSPGTGIEGRVDGLRVALGRTTVFGLDPGPAVLQRLEAFTRAGRSVVAVAIDGEPAGIIALADETRAEACAALRDLKGLGIRRTIMLTGDLRAVADQVAREVGVDEHRSELLPAQKLTEIQALVREHGIVAMIGDGVNDAPALANASIGIAMGGAGTDVAMETADVVLMADDLSRLPYAIGLSRRSRRIIIQNLFIALGTIVLLAPAGALGFIALGAAVAIHEGSTVVVVANALRLLRYGRSTAPRASAVPGTRSRP